MNGEFSWFLRCFVLFSFLSSSTNLFMLSKASWKGKIPFPCEAPAAPCHPAFCKRRIQTIQGRSLLPELENVKLLDESIVICWNLSYPLNHGQSSNTLSDSNYSLTSSQIIFAAQCHRDNVVKKVMNGKCHRQHCQIVYICKIWKILKIVSIIDQLCLYCQQCLLWQQKQYLYSSGAPLQWLN